MHWNPKSKQPKVINILARLHIDITLNFLFFSGITQGFVQAYFTNLSNGMRGHDQFKNKAAYRVAGLGLGIGRKSLGGGGNSKKVNTHPKIPEIDLDFLDFFRLL